MLSFVLIGSGMIRWSKVCMSSSGDKRAELLVDLRKGEREDDKALQEGNDMEAWTEIMIGRIFVFNLEQYHLVSVDPRGHSKAQATCRRYAQGEIGNP